MNKNLHLIDRLFRFGLGIIGLAWAFAGGPFWAYASIALIATAAWGYCPIYWALKINR